MAVFLAWFWFGGVSMAEWCAISTTKSDDHVASITKDNSTNYYCTLPSAIEAASGNDTIVMEKNYSFPDNSKIVVSKNLTLDLNWFLVEKTFPDTQYLLDINQNITLTIKDSGQNWKISRKNWMTAIRVLWTLIVDWWTIESIYNPKYSITIKCDENGFWNWWHVVINNWTIIWWKWQAIQAWWNVEIKGWLIQWDVISRSNGNYNPWNIIIDDWTISWDVATIQWLPTSHSSEVKIKWWEIKGTVYAQYNKDWVPATDTLPADNIPEGTPAPIFTIEWWTFSNTVPSEFLLDSANITVTAAEARIWNIQYKTLADAIDAANDDSNTIDLLNNISLSNTIWITKDLTINLNNYNIKATDARALWIKNWDVIITGSWTISANAAEWGNFNDSSSVIRVGDSSENDDKAFLTVWENVSVTSNHCYGITVFWKNDMELIMNGTVDVSGVSPAISWNWSAGLANTNITIGSNAKVKATQDTAIYYPGGWELNVKWWTIEGFNWIVARAWTIKIAADTVFNVSWDWNRKVWDANDPLVLKWKAIIMDIAASYPKSQNSDFIVENELWETFVIVWTKDSYNTYSVKYGENVENQTVKLTKDGTSAKIAKPADPTKNCNKFDGWFVWNDKYNFDAVVTWDLALVSKWTYTCSSSGGGSSGWSSSSSSSSKTTTTNNTWSTNTWTNANSTTSNTEEINLGWEVSEESTPSSEETSTPDNGYSKEFNDAYTWAFKNGITTMSPIEKADMNAPLTRIAMAKMLSQYAINVLGRTPDTTKVVPAFPDVSAELDAAYNSWVTLAYQLGIMWINIDKFRPDDLVTRAEFGTALSRMLYATADWEKAYYETHLAKLMEEKIITVDTPDLQELRGYVMIMLMRSANK